ncbi:MAG: hypothetical protein ABIH11_03115 [Candidatus Altiarchaeota archaeon]
MKVLVFVGGGGGLGTASRSIALGEKFIGQGFDVVFGSFGRSLDFIRRQGFDAGRVSAEMGFVLSDGHLSERDSTLQYVRNMLLFKMRSLAKFIARENPDLIVSDSYLPGAVASVLNGKPTYPLMNILHREVYASRENGFNVGWQTGVGCMGPCVFKVCERVNP